MKNQGQSIIEFLLLTACVCVVVIVFLSPAGPFRGAMENSLDLLMINKIETMSQKVTLNLNLVP